jgi:repressor LexA
MPPLSPVQKELYDWLVDYIRQHRHAPSIRQMMQAMGLKSPAPVQSRLEHLKNKGYINWQQGQARTLQILHPTGIPYTGAIAAQGWVRQQAPTEWLHFDRFAAQPNCFALRVEGDALQSLQIQAEDVLILQAAPAKLDNGSLITAQVADAGTLLGYYTRDGRKQTLQPIADELAAIALSTPQIQAQLVGVWRSYLSP